RANCECGYSVKGGGTYTDAFEADFLRLTDISNNGDWKISSWPEDQKPYPLSYEKQNVIANPITGSSGQSANGADPGLQLVVRGPTQEGSHVGAAEVMTSRRDMHYGSYRAAIKYSEEPGTCGSMFWYKNETQEIDVELLSYQDTKSSSTAPVNYVLHAKGPAGWAAPQLPFHPSDGYHEYRYDWSPGKVSFYADGQYIQDLTEGVPEASGSILLNHWSNGDPYWSQGPPVRDVVMTVAYVKAYFNTSSDSLQARSQCVNPTAKNAVCQVEDQSGPVSPGQDTNYLTKQGANNSQPQPQSTSNNLHSATSLGSSGPVASDGAVAKQVSPDATCGAVTDG
ncbi:MAG: hypothetical protein LQ338_008283, partial [Usnochroma carphineum]